MDRAVSSQVLTRDTSRFFRKEMMPNPSAIVDSLPIGEQGIFNRNRSDGDIDPFKSSPTSPDSSKHIGCCSTGQQQQATEIVKALFGNESIGKVVGVYSCSVARQSGKLYVSTDGLFFYSVRSEYFLFPLTVKSPHLIIFDLFQESIWLREAYMHKI